MSASHPVIDNEASPSRGSVLKILPLAALALGLGLFVLLGLSLPSSSAPSQDGVVTAVVALWALGVVAMGSSVLLANVGPQHLRLAVGAGLVALMTFVGWRVALRLDVVWIDACEFGSGSGDRCVDRDGSAPDIIGVVWPVGGASIGLIAAALGLATRHRS